MSNYHTSDERILHRDTENYTSSLPYDHHTFQYKAERVEWDPEGVAEPGDETIVHVVHPQHVIRVPVECTFVNSHS